MASYVICDVTDEMQVQTTIAQVYKSSHNLPCLTDTNFNGTQQGEARK